METRPILIRGGGFHAFWYGLGHGHAIIEQGQDIPYIMGYSAGALAAVLLAFKELDCATIARVAANLVPDCRFGCLDNVIRKMLTELLHLDAHIRLNDGFVRILLCSYADYFRGKIVSQWDSKEQLIDCVVASCFIPGVVGMSFCDPVYRCLDGSMALDLNALCEGHYEVGTISPGWCATFQAITEEEAMELFNTGKGHAVL